MPRNVKIDSIDRQLLARLQADGRIKHSQLASQCNIPESTARDRIKRLEDHDAILGYTTIIGLGSLGLIDQCVNLQITAPRPAAFLAFEAELRAMPEVASALRFIGQGRYLIRGLGAEFSHCLANAAHRAGVTIKECQTDAIALEIKALRGSPLPILQLAG